MHNTRIPKKWIALVPSTLVTISLAACGVSGSGSTDEPTAFVTNAGAGTIAGPGGAIAVTGPIAVVVADTSGSVVGTDLLKAAENKTRDLVSEMPVGAKVVVRALNNNVGAMCDDLVFSLEAQANVDVTDQLRQANTVAVDAKFSAYIACSTSHDQGGTELWGGLAEVFSYYPSAQIFEVYTDGCDTTGPTMCNARNLRRPTFPQQLLGQIPATLTPRLSPSVRITYHGIGRDTGLPADGVATLRSIIATWTQRTQATPYFTAS
jgi:hypothetical protein